MPCSSSLGPLYFGVNSGLMLTAHLQSTNTEHSTYGLLSLINYTYIALCLILVAYAERKRSIQSKRY